jgi:hypothetical protein
MLTDLCLTGYLEDNGGTPSRSSDSCPHDPVLRAAFEWVVASKPKPWSRLIAVDPREACQVVRDQLEAAGWVTVQRRAVLGIIPARLRLYDDVMVGGLADRVSTALNNAIDGRPADPRPLAVGLLGAQAQLPTVFSREEGWAHREVIRELTLAAIEPILGLHQAVLRHLEDRRADQMGI